MISLANAITNTIPITLFNRGLAGKIFTDIKKTGPKIVIKNNVPEAIILSPEEYLREQQELEDLKLLLTATERYENTNSKDYISIEEIDKEFGFSADDLTDADEVEIE